MADVLSVMHTLNLTQNFETLVERAHRSGYVVEHDVGGIVCIFRNITGVVIDERGKVTDFSTGVAVENPWLYLGLGDGR